VCVEGVIKGGKRTANHESSDWCLTSLKPGLGWSPPKGSAKMEKAGPRRGGVGKGREVPNSNKLFR